MKIIIALIILLSSLSVVFAQSEKPTLQITGTVKEIALQEIPPNSDSSFYITYIKLNLKLENKGSVPVIFLQPNPLSVFAKVISIKEGNEILLAESDNVGPAFAMLEKDWKKLKKSLNKSIPPNKKTRTIKPSESFEFEGFVRLNIPKSYQHQPILGGETKTLNFMKSHSPAQINIICLTWTTLPLFSKGKSRDYEKAEFADELRYKWKNVGYLWTDEIKVEPIIIDFNSVVFKKLI